MVKFSVVVVVEKRLSWGRSGNVHLDLEKYPLSQGNLHDSVVLTFDDWYVT